MQDNAAQLEYWNGPAGQRWAALQERIDANLGKITDAFFAFAKIPPGARVLDIGCGCGTTTLKLAQIVGPSGEALGADISKPMLGVAMARASAAGSGARFIEADASAHAFPPAHFTHVASRFGVMFFADPAEAFANIRRAMAKDARLAFVCWGPVEKNAWVTEAMAIALPMLPPQEPPVPGAPGPFAFANADRLRGILTQAGFKNVAIEPLKSVMYLGKNGENAAQESLSIGPLARAVTEADEATREKIRAALVKRYDTLTTPEGVNLGTACWLVAATA